MPLPTSGVAAVWHKIVEGRPLGISCLTMTRTTELDDTHHGESNAPTTSRAQAAREDDTVNNLHHSFSKLEKFVNASADDLKETCDSPRGVPFVLRIDCAGLTCAMFQEGSEESSMGRVR